MNGKNFYYNIVKFSQRHSKAVIITTILITILMAISMSNIRVNADYSTLLGDDEASKNYEELNANKDASDDIIITIKGSNLYEPEVLTAIEMAMHEIESFENVVVGSHPFSMVTAEKKSGRLVIVPINPHTGDEPWTDAEASLFKDRLLNDTIAKNLVVSEDGEMMLFFFPMRSLGDGNSDQYAAVKRLVAPIEEYAEVSINGGLAITESVTNYLIRDLFTLLSISFIVIMLVYYLSFRAKRSVFLPLSVVMMGVIWCLGIMSLLGYDLTIFNIVTPPLVLTLGSSYSIHLLNEYYRSHRETEDDNDKEWIAGAVFHINKTIVLACVTSVAGFLSLLVTEIEQFQEFGVSTAIGITVCAILTLFYLPAALHQLPNPSKSQMKLVREGGVTKVVSRIGDIVISHWKVILLAFLVLIVGFLFAFPKVEFETNYTKYFQEDDPIVVSSKDYIAHVGGVDLLYVTLKAPEGVDDYFMNPDVLRSVDAFEQSTCAITDDITHKMSFSGYVKFLDGVMDGEENIPESPGLIMLLSRYLSLITGMDENNNEMKMLISEDHNQMTIAFRYRDTQNMATIGLENTLSVIAAIDESALLLPGDVEVVTWGNGLRYLSLSDKIQSDQRRSTLASIIVVFLITALTFRSIGFGFFSIIPIAVGIMANYIFMVSFNIPFDMITMGFSSVTVGVGIDDAIHFIIRFKEIEGKSSDSLKQNIKDTIIQTGRPITLTSVSIIAGLMVLSFASFMPVRFFGILISIALFNTLLATLFILPAFMYGGLTFARKIKAKRA